MAQGEGGGDHNVLPIRPELWGPHGGGPYGPGIEVRVAKLEAAVEHLQSDLSDVKAALGRIDPRISEMAGAMPHLATKADIGKRPTVAGIVAIVALIAAVASIPIWPEWAAALKAIAAASH